LLTVMVPVLVPRPPVVNVGLANASVAPVIAKFTVLVEPFAVVFTVMVLVVSAAPLAITQLAVTVVAVGVPVMVQVTFVPDTVIDEAPARSMPVNVIACVVPRTPKVGATELSAGVTVNVTVGVVTPLVVTLTVRAPTAAPDAITRLAVTVRPFGLGTMVLTLIPAPDTLTAVAPAKPVPVRVTGTVVPLRPEVGAMEVSVGELIVNVTVLVFTPFVVTKTDRAPAVAPAAITKLAVTVVSVGVPVMVAVMLAPGLIAVAPAKPVPVRVTCTVAPLKPELGAMEVSVGLCTVNVMALVTPVGVVTVTFRAPAVAPAAMTKLAVTVVAVGVPVMVAVTLVPDTVTAEAPARLVPVRVTATVVPR
jgi:hypothetical protein